MRLVPTALSVLAMVVAIGATPVAAMECVPMDDILDPATTSWPVFKPVTFPSGIKMKLWTSYFMPSKNETNLDNPSIGSGNQCGGSNSAMVLHENASGLYGQIAGAGVNKVLFKMCNFSPEGNLSGDVAAAQFIGDITAVSGEALSGPFGEPMEATATPAPSGSGHELVLSGDAIGTFIVAAYKLDIAEICVE